MSEEMIGESTILNCKYEYYLIKSICNIESIGNKLRYGIKVNSYDFNNNLVDTKCIFDIFGNKSKMIRVIKTLKRLQVTPVTLEDIIIDNI